MTNFPLILCLFFLDKITRHQIQMIYLALITEIVEKRKGCDEISTQKHRN